MAREEIAPLLARDFLTLKIDTDRTIGGQTLMETVKKARQGGLPWFAFLDSSGKELVSSNDPQGDNIGCPDKDEEISWFLEMLKKSAPSLTADDLTAIQRSLIAARSKQG